MATDQPKNPPNDPKAYDVWVEGKVLWMYEPTDITEPDVCTWVSKPGLIAPDPEPDPKPNPVNPAGPVAPGELAQETRLPPVAAMRFDQPARASGLPRATGGSRRGR